MLKAVGPCFKEGQTQLDTRTSLVVSLRKLELNTFLFSVRQLNTLPLLVYQM